MIQGQIKTIVSLVVILLIVVAVSVAAIMYVPSLINKKTPSNTTLNNAIGQSATFDTSVLQSQNFLLLNMQPVNEGALPVQPPAATGKVNPFLP